MKKPREYTLPVEDCCRQILSTQAENLLYNFRHSWGLTLATGTLVLNVNCLSNLNTISEINSELMSAPIVWKHSCPLITGVLSKAIMSSALTVNASGWHSCRKNVRTPYPHTSTCFPPFQTATCLSWERRTAYDRCTSTCDGKEHIQPQSIIYTWYRHKPWYKQFPCPGS